MVPNSEKLKHVAFYSKDFNIGYSFLIYLQNIYKVTATTDINILTSIVELNSVDLVIIDADPTDKIEFLIEELTQKKPSIHVFLTYVYKDQIKDIDIRLRKYVNSVFYKPYDLNEITRQLSALMI